MGPEAVWMDAGVLDRAAGVLRRSPPAPRFAAAVGAAVADRALSDFAAAVAAFDAAMTENVSPIAQALAAAVADARRADGAAGPA